MPNRILKEGIRTSKQIGSLDDFCFRVWAYLLTYVDDFGRGSADAELLKGFLFSRRKGTTEKNIADALDKLACAGLICLYKVDDEPFLCFPTWGEHQRIRTKVSKFPAPEEKDLLTYDSNLLTNDSNLPPESNTIQSNPNPESNPESESNNSALHAEIVAYLNEICGTAYRASNKKTQALINARLSDGFTVDDFKTVIDKKHAEWADDPKMSAFLRPETLFSPKFEGYLNQRIVTKASGDEFLEYMRLAAEGREPI